jgi:hypothetical protein
MEQAIGRGSRGRKPTEAVTFDEAEEPAERRRPNLTASVIGNFADFSDWRVAASEVDPERGTAGAAS